MDNGRSVAVLLLGLTLIPKLVVFFRSLLIAYYVLVTLGVWAVSSVGLINACLRFHKSSQS